jgi:hypothetical protein
MFLYETSNWTLSDGEYKNTRYMNIADKNGVHDMVFDVRELNDTLYIMDRSQYFVTYRDVYADVLSELSREVSPYVKNKLRVQMAADDPVWAEHGGKHYETVYYDDLVAEIERIMADNKATGA